MFRNSEFTVSTQQSIKWDFQNVMLGQINSLAMFLFIMTMC